MKAYMRFVIAALVVFAAGSYLAETARAQSVSGTPESITAGAGKFWWAYFDGTTHRTFRATSTEFDPVVTVELSDGRRFAGLGQRNGGAAQVLVPAANWGWVKVWVTGAGNGSGSLYFQIDERPFVQPAPLPPQPPQPQQPQAQPQPPQKGADIKILLMWTEKVDLDLWVLEPGGNPNNERDWISYKKHRGAGKLSPDNTNGGGTSFELYEVTNGPRESYRIKVKFFNDHRTPAEGKGRDVSFRLVATRSGENAIDVTSSLRPIRDEEYRATR